MPRATGSAALQSSAVARRILRHERPVVVAVAAALEDALFDVLLELLAHVAEPLGRRDPERLGEQRCRCPSAAAASSRPRPRGRSMRRPRSADLPNAAALLLGALRRDVRAAERSRRSRRPSPISRAKRRTAESVQRRLVLARAQVVQDQEVDALAELAARSRGAARRACGTSPRRPRVTEEVHLAVGLDACASRLADVVEQRAPAHLEARHRLPHDLLRVLPDVLVAPLAVAEADEACDLGQPHVEAARHVEGIETRFGELPDEQAVELRRISEIGSARHSSGEGRRGGVSSSEGSRATSAAHLTATKATFESMAEAVSIDMPRSPPASRRAAAEYAGASEATQGLRRAVSLSAVPVRGLDHGGQSASTHVSKVPPSSPHAKAARTAAWSEPA